MAESYSVEAYLKATGVDQFGRAFQNATKSVEGVDRASQTATISIGSLIKAIAGSAVVVGAFNAIRNSVSGAVSRFDTLNTFPNVLEMMGFSAEESEKSISRLSEGIDGLPTALDEVASTAQRIAIMTNDLDGATETTLALNNAFLASGSSSADASRGLDQYVQMLAKGGVDLQSWRTLQETMPVALNEVAKAFGYTGASAQNDLYEALKEGNVTFDQFNGKLIELSNKTGGFADMAKESSTGIATSWQNVKTAIVKGVADMIGTIDSSLSSFGGIAGAFDSLKEGVKKSFGWINTNLPKAINLFKQVYETIKPWLPLIASVVVAFLTFNTTISVIDGVKKAVTGLKIAFTALKTAMLANPIALIIGALAGLAIMFVHLWKTSETFREKVTEVFNAITAFIMPVINGIVSFVMDIWGGLVAWWQENGEMILQAAQNVWNMISTIISTVMEIIWGIMQDLWPKIQRIITTVWETIKGIIQGAINVITGIIQFWSAVFTGDWSAAWNAVKKILSGALNIIKSVIKGAFNLIKSIISAVMTAIKSVISNVWNGIKSVVSTVVNSIKEKISNVFNSLKTVVSTAFNKVKEAVKNGINKALDIIVNIKEKFKEAGKNIITSIASGIKGAVSKVTGAIGGVVDKIRGFLPFSPAKEGPLRDIHRLNFGGPIADSIKRATPIVQSGLASMLALPAMQSVDIAGQVARTNASINSRVDHQINNSNSRLENLLRDALNRKQVIVLDSGVLVGETTDQYSESLGDNSRSRRRWGL